MSQQIVKIFIRKTGCPKCHKVLEDCKTLSNQGIKFELYDIDTVDGLAEASYFGVMSTPAIIKVDEEGEEIVKGTE